MKHGGGSARDAAISYVVFNCQYVSGSHMCMLACVASNVCSSVTFSDVRRWYLCLGMSSVIRCRSEDTIFWIDSPCVLIEARWFWIASFITCLIFLYQRGRSKSCQNSKWNWSKSKLQSSYRCWKWRWGGRICRSRSAFWIPGCGIGSRKWW